jgi:hypothetical protein
MRAALLLAVLVLPATAQNTYDIEGTTVGAPQASLPAFGSTPSDCQLTEQPEPYQVHGFRGSLGGSYTVSVKEPIDIGFGDDTVLLLYRGPFDPANPCSEFVAVGNETPGAGLTQTLEADQAYALVVAGFLGSEDAYAVRVTGPEGSTVGFDPLPVELAAFEAVRRGADVRLGWETASETNNAGFAVEMAVGDEAWRQVGWVEGAGTTVEAQRYAFAHSGAPHSALRYRLRQVDLDGTPTIGPVVEVAAALEAPLWLGEVAPHPAQGASEIAFAVREAESVTLTLYDALGRRVRTLWQGTPAAGASVRAAIGELPAGLYVLRLTSTSAETTRAFVATR